jgi:hypothetical protein
LTPNQTRVDLKANIPDNVAIDEDFADEHAGQIHVPDLAAGQEFFFQILIKYHGPFSTGHETSVCWRWDMSTLRLNFYNNAAFNFMT